MYVYEDLTSLFAYSGMTLRIHIMYMAQPFVRNKIRIAFGNFSVKKYIFFILNITFIGNPEKQFQIEIFHLL